MANAGASLIAGQQCDHKVPGCSQCLRANVACPGYRDAFSLKLRDLTHTTARKARQRASKNGTQSPKEAPECHALVNKSGTAGGILAVIELPQISKGISHIMQVGNAPSPGSSSSSLSRVDPSPEGDGRDLPLAVLNVHPQDAALAYFMTCCAPLSSFSYLPDVYPTVGQSENIRDALLAPSLVSLSHHLTSPPLQRLAYTHYARALTYTNKALSDSGLAVLDSTLLSVLLLGLFEALIFKGRQTPNNWDAHTQGSMALLRLRGEAQLETRLGEYLFLHASGIINVGCAQRCIKVPSELGSLQQHAIRSIGQQNPGIRTQSMVQAFAELRLELYKAPPLQLLQKALELNEEVLAMLEDLDKLAPFEVVSSGPILERISAYKGRFYKYSSLRISRHWNTMRLLRLFINDCIYEITSLEDIDLRIPGDKTKKQQSRIRSTAKASAEEAISGILYSAPFALELSECPFLSARLLIYAFSSIVVSDLTPPSAALFARNRLAFISTQYGLRQATESIAMVSESEYLEDWCV